MDHLAAPTGLEPAISCVTGRRDRPSSLRSYIGTGSWRSNHDFSGQSRAYYRYTKPVLWWRKLDLNQRRPKPTDLQSAAIDQALPFLHMGLPTGDDPANSGLKGRQLYLFVHGSIFNARRVFPLGSYRTPCIVLICSCVMRSQQLELDDQ